ncbi:MAG: hypothetical protein FJX67_06830 [Alphaproteobacteria bacterium]|nr:hypothetical protein [Alphaproteobacteria bacterium]
MAKITAEQAFELSREFRLLSIAIGDYRFANCDALKPAERQKLEDQEWSLLNASSDMRTQAVGLLLDETEIGIKGLSETTGKAKSALASAVLAKDAGAVAKNAKAIYDAASSL